MGLKIDIDTGNEAFQGIAGEHCGELLIEVARKLAMGVTAGAIFDGNGNKVGAYLLDHEDAES